MLHKGMSSILIYIDVEILQKHFEEHVHIISEMLLHICVPINFNVD